MMSAVLVTRTDEQSWAQKPLFETILSPLSDEERKKSATPIAGKVSQFTF